MRKLKCSVLVCQKEEHMIDPIKVEHQGLEYLGYVFANDHTG